MRIIAYLYSEPTWESIPDSAIWGWEVDQIYQDMSEQRPQLQQLLLDCQVRPANYLLLRRLAELGGSVQAVSQQVAQLQAMGLQVIATEQDYPLIDSNATASQPLQLLKLLEEVQHQQRTRRLQRGHALNRLKALPPPGKAPYGYRRSKDRYVIDRSAAPVLKDFFEHFLLYGSLRGAVRYLDKKYSKKISVSTGRRWLTSPIYRGDLVYQTNQVILDTHTPIVSREEAAQVDRLLRRNRSFAPRAASAPRSLAGLVVCGACQSPMVVAQVSASRRSQEYLYLRPTACPQQPKCRAIAYQQVLDQTICRICCDLPDAVAMVNMAGVGNAKVTIEAGIAAKQQALSQLPALVACEVLDSQTAQLRAYTLRIEISQLQNKLTQLPPINLRKIAQTVSLPQFWLDLSETERRFYFREFIQQIQIIRQEAAWTLQLVFVF